MPFKGPVSQLLTTYCTAHNTCPPRSARRPHQVGKGASATGIATQTPSVTTTPPQATFAKTYYAADAPTIAYTPTVIHWKPGYGPNARAAVGAEWRRAPLQRALVACAAPRRLMTVLACIVGSARAAQPRLTLPYSSQTRLQPPPC